MDANNFALLGSFSVFLKFHILWPDTGSFGNLRTPTNDTSIKFFNECIFFSFCVLCTEKSRGVHLKRLTGREAIKNSVETYKYFFELSVNAS